ncbi:MAG: 2-C-methyl-D-erythritol 2,4-cyclodiphosphate synthase [Pyrinomonadaceae bacterium]|nr:2-C-methyl-D-erythritol 2,4-cyclodiphosphate synthase [Pyrinomonadaceae bacterium]
MDYMRIGFGNDVHRLETGLTLKIGGVAIKAEAGAVGHSDADVLLHAITDAVLGALSLGDIGSHFPPSDERWKNADSTIFLREAVSLMKERGFQVGNVDSTVSLEKTRLRPYIDDMKATIAELLDTETANVSVKAKTGEGVDSVGESRAIKAEACILLKRISS